MCLIGNLDLHLVSNQVIQPGIPGCVNKETQNIDITTSFLNHDQIRTYLGKK